LLIIGSAPRLAESDPAGAGSAGVALE